MLAGIWFINIPTNTTRPIDTDGDGQISFEEFKQVSVHTRYCKHPTSTPTPTLCDPVSPSPSPSPSHIQPPRACTLADVHGQRGAVDKRGASLLCYLASVFSSPLLEDQTVGLSFHVMYGAFTLSRALHR